MPAIERISVDYQPTWHQWDFHQARADHHFRWLCTGVGAGKTWCGVAEALVLAAEINAGAPGLIVVPEFATFQDVIRPAIDAIWPREIYRIRTVQSRPQIEVDTPSGTSTIYVRSAHDRRNVDKINGLTVAWAYLEEAGRFKHGNLAWRYVLQRMRHHAAHNGVFIAASPRPGWLPDAFHVASGLPPEASQRGYSPAPGYYVRQASTEANPHNADQYASRMRAIFGGDFARQELDGAIVQASGLVYPEWAPGLHVVPHAVAERLYSAARRRVGGIDFGWSSPMAAVWGGWCGAGAEMLAIVGEWYRTQRQVQELCHDLSRDAGEVTTWYCDAADPGAISELAEGHAIWQGQRCRIPAVAADKSWRAGTDAVRNLMHRRSGLDHPAHPRGNGLGAPRLIISDRCQNLIRELGEYRDANDPDDDRTPREAATSGDDHAIDCLRYLVYNSLRQHSYRGQRATI